MCLDGWKERTSTLPGLHFHLTRLFVLSLGKIPLHVLSGFLQGFLKVRIRVYIPRRAVMRWLAAPSAGVNSWDPQNPLKIPTPNPCACLLRPLLNIYIPIQTVSEGKPHHSALFCISMPPSSLPLPPRGRKKSQSIHSNQSDETKQQYTGRTRA